MASATAQLWAAERFVPAGGSNLYAADAGAGQVEPGGGTGRLDSANPKEPGSDERAGAPSGIRHRRGNGDGDSAGDRGGGRRSPSNCGGTGGKITCSRSSKG